MFSNFKKQISIYFITPLFLFLLFSQNIFGTREDYPLSCWGMYKKLRTEGPYKKISIEAIKGVKKINIMREIGGVSFLIDDLIQQKALGNIKRDKMIPIIKPIGGEKKPMDIHLLIKEHLFPVFKENKMNLSGYKLTIYLNSWESLNRNNLFQPSEKKVIHEEILNDFN